MAYKVRHFLVELREQVIEIHAVSLLSYRCTLFCSRA